MTNTRVCRTCASEKHLETEFYKCNGRYQTECKKCANAKAVIRVAAWAKKNRERVRGYGRKRRTLLREQENSRTLAWYYKNKERALQRKATWKLANKDSVKAANAQWKKNNKWKVVASTVRRYAAMLNATPKWASKESIEKFYMMAARLTAETGKKHHVDHIIPLQSKLVCGLHVEHNLQVLPHDINESKGNRYWPDMPNQQESVCRA